MDTVEKNLLIGAFGTGLVASGLEGYYDYTVASGTPLRDQFPYMIIHPMIPPVGDWIVCALLPAGLWLMGKYTKKASLVQMAKGGAIYGASELIGQTVYRVVRESQPAAARYSPMARGYSVIR